MIKTYIKNAINDIKTLIDLTKKDIEDAKMAYHENIAKRVDQKNHLTISFETNKSLLNEELSKLPNLEIFNLPSSSILDFIVSKKVSTNSVASLLVQLISSIIESIKSFLVII